jgi:drug/metabolite transporter (DMT)-like permease
VLAAAFMHALWNLILKKSQDKAVAVLSIFFCSLPLALAGLWISGLPKMTSIPVILFSAILQTGYCISLFKAYDRAQLSRVYPVARGSAPVFVFIASYIFFDPEMSLKTFAGIVIICVGLIAYGLVQLWKNNEGREQLTFAIITGLFIASYSITDAYGVRLVGSALSFYGAMALFNRLFLFLYLIVLERNFLPRLVTGYQHSFFFGGLISFVCYLIILEAYQHLPVALVSSLRETSIVFAILLGGMCLKEKMTVDKIALVLVLALGIVFLYSP